jgi:uncharacterized membrane protein YgcG
MQEAKIASSAAAGTQTALSQRLMRELRNAVLSFSMEEAEPLCGRVKENLFEASDRSTRVDEQNVLLTAYTALIKGSPNFIRMLRLQLPMAVEKALESDKTAVVVDMTTTQRLKLVEVEDVEREVLILNMVRKLEDFCGDTLSPLTLRICHLKGIEHVHLQLNPFKPETFVRGFTDAWEAFDGNKLSTRVMLRSLNIANFLPLNALYSELNELLINNDVMREERYSIRRTAESPAGALWKRSNAASGPRQALSIEGMGQGGGGSGGGGGAGGAGGDFAELSNNLNSVLGQSPASEDGGNSASGPVTSWNFNPSRFLHQVTLLLETAGNARPRNPDDPVQPVVGAPDRRLMSRLNDLMVQSKNAANDVDPSAADAANFETIELEALRDEPEVASATEIDRATIEMLTRVFRFALGDDSIPPTLKVLIGSLQLPVLTAALEDRAFFVTADHPARRLVDLLARVGMFWTDDPDDALHQSVQAIVARAREGSSDNAALFRSLDVELEALLTERESHFSERDAMSIAEIAQLEARHEAAEEVKLRLMRRITSDMDEPLKNFLNGVWHDVWIERYLTRDAQPEAWQTLQEQTDILIWSVLPKNSNVETTELRNALPTLLRTINEGLDTVKCPTEERQAFMQYLMDRQASAVRKARQTVHGATAPPTSFPEPSEEIFDIDGSELARKASVEDDGFERNQWFALDLGLDQPFKYRLSWISPRRTKFVLTTRDGGEALVKTLPELQQLLESGSLARLETAPLTGRALAQTFGAAA